MKHVILEGELGDKYGRDWHMKASAFIDVFECIEANYPGFRNDLITMVEAGSNFSIMSGKDFIDEQELVLPISSDTIVIAAIPAGAKSGGAKILIGAALLAAVFFLPVLAPAAGAAAGAANVSLAAAAAASGASTATVVAANVAISVGLNLVLVGLQQMLAPDPSVDDNDQNYLFDGPENTVVAGQPVPYLFGRKIIGGTPINSSIIVGNLPRTTGYYNWPGFRGGFLSGGGFINDSGGHIDFTSLVGGDLSGLNLTDLSTVYPDIL